MQKDIFLQENVTVCIQYILHGKNTVDYGEAFREGSQKKKCTNLKNNWKFTKETLRNKIHFLSYKARENKVNWKEKG